MRKILLLLITILFPFNLFSEEFKILDSVFVKSENGIQYCYSIDFDKSLKEIREAKFRIESAGSKEKIRTSITKIISSSYTESFIDSLKNGSIVKSEKKTWKKTEVQNGFFQEIITYNKKNNNYYKNFKQEIYDTISNGVKFKTTLSYYWWKTKNKWFKYYMTRYGTKIDTEEQVVEIRRSYDTTFGEAIYDVDEKIFDNLGRLISHTVTYHDVYAPIDNWMALYISYSEDGKSDTLKAPWACLDEYYITERFWGENGLDSAISYEYFPYDSLRDTAQRCDFHYEDGLLKDSIVQLYRNNKFLDYRKSSFEYFQNRKIKSAVTQEYINDVWEIVSKEFYTYDQNDGNDFYLLEEYDESLIINSEWEYKVYDNQGLVKDRIRFRKNGKDSIIIKRIQNEYDEYGRKTLSANYEVQKFNTFNSGREWEYDGENLVKIKFLNYSSNFDLLPALFPVPYKMDTPFGIKTFDPYEEIHFFWQKISSMKERKNTLSDNISYPNPAQDFVNIKYKLENNSIVYIVIFDQNGKEIKRIESTYQKPGLHSYKLETNHFTNGLYFYSIYAGEQVINGRFIIAK